MGLKIKYFCLALLLFFPAALFASSEGGDTLKTEKFQPGPFIIDHVVDSHEWHIAKIGHTHVSVPLPIILYSEHTGLHFFMSSNLHHGEEEYQNFRLMSEGVNKGKIVEKLTDGAEYVPYDFSLTKTTTAMLLSWALLLFVFLKVASAYKNNQGKGPKGLQNLMEIFIIFIRDDIAKSSIGHKYERYMPFLLTVFFFILANNLLGLIPIFPAGANVTGNIAVTMVLAAFTFVITTVSANLNYWKHIINAPGVPWWLKFPVPLMPVVEIMGVFTKPFVLMIRLFANITGGHIVGLGFFSLIFIFGEINVGAGFGISILSLSFSIFMGFLEILVAFIQAYVFTLLSALYFGMAIEEAHH